MDPADRPLFNTLCDWRREHSKHDGVPSYVICNDRTLALVTQQRRQSLAKLGEVSGFGPAKVKKYGAELLDFMQDPTAASEQPPARVDDAPSDA